ncbi:hypothetical protein K9L05_02185 [Candidatus Babeliales bacterium]|nr:hypothetical protein [Candidatus Babeliales bacterium]
MKKILWLFLASLFISINLVKPAREKISLTTPEFQNELERAVKMPPGPEKIKKYEQLRPESVELGQQKVFIDNLQRWVEKRRDIETKSLSEFINYTTYNPDFSNFRDRLKKLSEKAKNPVSFVEKIERLNNQINKAQTSTERKEEFLKKKDEVLKEMGNLFMQRGGKSADELSRLQGLLNTAKFSNLFTDPEDVKRLDSWIENVSTPPSVDEKANYIWQEIQSGIATENSDIFFKKLTSFLEEVDKAYREGTLKMTFELLPKILRAVAYSSSFTKDQQDQAAKWLREVQDAMKPKIDEDIPFAQHLDRLIDMILDPTTFTDANNKNYLFDFLQSLIDIRVIAKPEEITKLQSCLSFIKWNESLTSDQKSRIDSFEEMSKTAPSFVEIVNKMMLELSKVAQDPSKKGEFLSRVDALAKSFVAAKVADKKPEGQEEVIDFLNLIKANPIFSDKETVDKINKMISDINAAKPGKAPGVTPAPAPSPTPQPVAPTPAPAPAPAKPTRHR